MQNPIRLLLPVLCILLHSSASWAADPSLVKIVDHYEAIVQSLSKGSIEGLESKVVEMRKAGEELQKNDSLPEDHRKMMEAALKNYSVASMTHARLGLHLLTMSIEAFAAVDPSLKLKKVRCQPAPADWLQREGQEIRNPYLGEAGKDCGLFLDLRPITKPDDMPQIQGDLLPKGSGKSEHYRPTDRPPTDSGRDGQ